ncbi:MAG: DUF5518 domain-containing protein [Methanomicrobiales archaeon]
MKLDLKVLLIGISLPTIFTLLWQIGGLIEFMYPQISIFVNLDTFISFLLVFIASIVVSMLSNANIKKSLIYGFLIGFLGELVSFMIIITFSVIILLKSNNFPFEMFNNEIIYYYLLPRIIFQILNGSIGGLIGHIMNKLMTIE